MGSYVLPMPEGHDLKKILYRAAQARAACEVTNRVMATRLLDRRRRPHRRRDGLRHAHRRVRT